MFKTKYLSYSLHQLLREMWDILAVVSRLLLISLC